MSLIILNSVTPEHKFDINITIDDADNSTWNYKMLSAPVFEYGNDEDIDTILYPSNCKIEFSIAASYVPLLGGSAPSFPQAYRDYEHEYFSLMNKFSFTDTSVIIYKDGVEEFRGYIDPKNKSGSFEKRSFELTALSDFSKLKDEDPSTYNPSELYTLPVNSYGNTVSFSDAIKKTVQKVLPSFSTVYVLSDLMSQTNYTFLGIPWHASADYFGDFSMYFWGNDKFDNAIDLIRSILNQFGCVGIVKGNNLYMQSRFSIPTQTALTLRAREFVKDEGPIPYYSQKLLGLHCFVGLKGDGTFYEEKYGDVDNSGASEVEVMKMYSCGGDPPGIDGGTYPLLVRNIWIRVPGYVAGLGNEQWIPSVRNSFYGGTRSVNQQTALWRVVADSIWNQIQYDRLVYQLKMKGTAWQYDKFYKFENGLAETFRARKLKYNFGSKSTVLDLIKC